jgi:type IV pilus assembly protein PilE
MAKQCSRRGAGQRGFTLVELLITVTILSIIMAFAYPSYMDQVRRANRADAREALTLLTNEMERFFATNRTYTTDLTNFSLPVSGGVTTSKAGHYAIVATAGNTGTIASSYTLTATPMAGDIQANDDACPSLSVDSAGNFLPTPSASDCW